MNAKVKICTHNRDPGKVENRDDEHERLFKENNFFVGASLTLNIDVVAWENVKDLLRVTF